VQNNDLEKTISLSGDRELFLQIVVLHLGPFPKRRHQLKSQNLNNKEYKSWSQNFRVKFQELEAEAQPQS
jgi:hypothetical protein